MSFGNDEFMDKLNSGDQLPKEQKELKKLFEEKQKLLVDQNKRFLEDLFNENSTKPIKVKQVQANNTGEFRTSFLNKQLLPLLNKNLFTLQDFLFNTDEVTKNFINGGVLENIMVQYNPMANRKYETIDVVPVFHLSPVKRFFAKTGSNIGNGEGDGYIQFQLRNLFGGGEHLSFDATTGTRTSSSYLINYNQPINNNTKYIWENLFYVNSRSLEWFKCDSKLKGMSNKLYTKFPLINHELQIDNVWRSLFNKSSKSMAVLNQAGDNFKSSVAYGIKYDSRDNIHLPTTGKFFKLGIEYAGISKFSSVNYLKSIAESQFTVPLNAFNHLIVSNKSGLLYSLNSPSFMLDRFFIGGPNDVRAFTLNGLGPKSYDCSIGGDLFLNGGISLISKIPYTPKDSNFKFHNFINYGNLQLYDNSLSLWQNTAGLFNQFSVSYGFGILYNHPMARFELNFVVPLAVHQRDYSRKGLQYGIGISFL